MKRLLSAALPLALLCAQAAQAAPHPPAVSTLSTAGIEFGAFGPASLVCAPPKSIVMSPAWVASRGPHSLTFYQCGVPVMVFAADGRLVPGPGLSTDEATRKTFDVMAKNWPEYADDWARSNGYVKPTDPATPPCTITGGVNVGVITQSCN